MTALDLKDMRERAEAWATDKHSGVRVSRDRAIGEDHMALDVLDLIAEVERLKAALAATSITDLELRTRLLEACDLFTHKADLGPYGGVAGIAKSQRMRINELRKLAES